MKFDLVTNLPRAWGEPIASAQFKSSPKDFIVRESLDFGFDNEGEHLYLHIRKCNLNTSEVQETLQKHFKCGSVDIGVSGLKDKVGITDQWFSVRTAMPLENTLLSSDTATSNESLTNEALSTEALTRETLTSEALTSEALTSEALTSEALTSEALTSEALTSEALTADSCDVNEDHATPLNEFVVLQTARHSRKLRRGAHRHNRFIITLRDVQSDISENSANTELSSDTKALIDARLETIKVHGFVNYFGPQRFGIGQQNLVKAERYFANTKRKISRVQRGMLISSARSLLFNIVCAKRVTDGTWNKPIGGEPMLLEGTHSFFINDAVAVDTDKRCRAGDVHPTGPMWGEGEPVATAECAELEDSLVSEYAAFAKGLAAEGLKQQRRALRASVEQLKWTWSAAGDLTLDFNLQKGVYATSFLAELLTLRTEGKV